MRNKNVDALRSIAILFVIISHSFAVTETMSSIPKFLGLRTIVAYGGEIGVTLFFILSGLGIAYSLGSSEKDGTVNSYWSFLGRRVRRVAPQYYVCIGILILFGAEVSNISVVGFRNIILHATFLHNFFLAYHGGINGALWTMGVIVQFYLIAPLLYKCLKRKPVLFLVVCLLFSILAKIVVYHILDTQGRDSYYYFVYGRQLFTSLDNFAIGMYIGYNLLYGKTIENKTFIWKLMLICGLIGTCGLIYISTIKNRLGNTKTGWLWYSCFAIVLGLTVWGMAQHKYCKILAPFVWMAKYEYGIYLYHLVIIRNLYSNSSVMNGLAVKFPWLFFIIITILSIIVGYISTETIDTRVKKRHCSSRVVS